MTLDEMFQILVPESKEYPEETRELFLQLATDKTSKRVFRYKWKEAICYLAGHNLVMTNERDGISGPLTGRRAGEVAENFGDPTIMGGGALSATSYGALYQNLLRRSPHVGPTVSGMRKPGVKQSH